MKIKLNRGPAKGKYIVVENDNAYEYVVQIAEPMKWNAMDYESMYPTAPVIAKRGTYYRSNVTLKNGAVVFEWMGWRE